MIFRPLRADEIECRVGTVGANGFTLLLYKDARTDMNILDETVGANNWQKDYKEIKGNLYCGVGIWDETKSQWIWKWDCGTESYTEKEKGEASDAFKRACFNAGGGIGRELYTAPFIFIRAKTEREGKGYHLCDRKDGYGYKVAQIEYEGGRISHLVITKNGTQVFTFTADKFMEDAQNTIDESMVQMVLTIAETPANKEVLHAMGIKTKRDIKAMTMEQYSEFIRRCNNG